MLYAVIGIAASEFRHRPRQLPPGSVINHGNGLRVPLSNSTKNFGNENYCSKLIVTSVPLSTELEISNEPFNKLRKSVIMKYPNWFPVSLSGF